MLFRFGRGNTLPFLLLKPALYLGGLIVVRLGGVRFPLGAKGIGTIVVSFRQITVHRKRLASFTERVLAGGNTRYRDDAIRP